MIRTGIIDALLGANEDVLYRWVALLIGQTIVLASVIFGYLSTKGKVAEVSQQATNAAELAAPTGNGFAKEVKDALSEIKAGLVRVEVKVDTHIQDHSRSSFEKDR